MMYEFVEKTLIIAAIFSISCLVYSLWRVTYNLYFHPLAKFPGPKYAAVSNFWYACLWPSGRWPFVLEDLHKKYGPVVRYAPNDLDFATPQSYTDIHGHHKPGKPTFLKSKWYDPDPGLQPSIVSIRDPAKHREVRRGLSHAFSAKALRTQTDVVLHYVDMWIAQIKRFGNTDRGINMEEWHNWLTFDIIGDLAFGESFGAVENARGHAWPATIKNSLEYMVYTDGFRRVPILKPFSPWLRGDHLAEERRKQFKNARTMVKRRMERGNDRDDFFGHVLSEKSPDVTEDFLTAQASTLIVAGSETTATFLAGTTYYLLKNPQTLQRLYHEIRSAFKTAGEINGDSTQGLPYLFGVMEEGLRMFPPVPAGLQRLSPGAEVDGYYVPVGVTVSTSGWTTTHTEKYFHDARNFHPERWLPQGHELYEERFGCDVKDASKPFGMGPRGCLGLNLAYLEMRIILSRLAWEFDWELISKDLDWERDIRLKVLWMKPDLMARFKPVSR